MTTPANALANQITRAKGILGDYKALGKTGSFMANFIETDIKTAVKAMNSGDWIEMARAGDVLAALREVGQ